MEKDLTIGDPFKVIVLFSLPIIGGNLFQLLYTLADTVIVGQVLGSDALAAVGSTGIIIYLVLCFVQGITGGFGICLGHQFGRRDGKQQSALLRLHGRAGDPHLRDDASGGENWLCWHLPCHAAGLDGCDCGIDSPVSQMLYREPLKNLILDHLLFLCQNRTI